MMAFPWRGVEIFDAISNDGYEVCILNKFYELDKKTKHQESLYYRTPLFSIQRTLYTVYLSFRRGEGKEGKRNVR